MFNTCLLLHVRQSLTLDNLSLIIEIIIVVILVINTTNYYLMLRLEAAWRDLDIGFVVSQPSTTDDGCALYELNVKHNILFKRWL